MKLKGVTAMFGKVAAIGLVAGAVALVAPVKAEAQRVVFGVQVGSPYYGGYDDGDARRDYWRHEQWERERAREAWERQRAWEQQRAWAQHEAHEQHERWEHARDYDRGRGYDYDRRDGYNDRDRGYYGR